MNALKHKNEQSKQYRDMQGFMLELLEMMAYAYALELHEQHGFAKKRNERIAEGAYYDDFQSVFACRKHKRRVNVIVFLMMVGLALYIECVARYETDYTQIALKSKCQDFGFVSKIKLDKKGAVTWE